MQGFGLLLWSYGYGTKTLIWEVQTLGGDGEGKSIARKGKMGSSVMLCILSQWWRDTWTTHQACWLCTQCFSAGCEETLCLGVIHGRRKGRGFICSSSSQFPFPTVKLPSRGANSPLFLLYHPIPWQLLRKQIPCPGSRRRIPREWGTNPVRKGGQIESEEMYEVCVLVHYLLLFWVDYKKDFVENGSNWSLPPAVLSMLLNTLQNELTDERLVRRREPPFILAENSPDRGMAFFFFF